MVGRGSVKGIHDTRPARKGTKPPPPRLTPGCLRAALKGTDMRITATITVLGCSLLALAGCKQETNYPAGEATTTAVMPVPGPTSTEVVAVPVPGPTSTEVVVVPGPTVTETAEPKATPSPQ